MSRADATLDLASELRDVPSARGRAPLQDYEYVRGWGVFGLPFDSGNVLALRVFPENDFSPYRTLWHRNPDGDWSIYVDGPRLDTACPRYYGPACTYTGFARINFEWTGPVSLRISMEDPSLEWRLVAGNTRFLRVLNAISPLLPLWTWRSSPLLRARELIANHVLGMGDMRLSGTMPSGHTGVLMPRRIYFIDDATAVLKGQDLGRPTVGESNPRIGEVALPARGVLAIGQAVWEILDPDEYARLRAETQPTPERPR